MSTIRRLKAIHYQLRSCRLCPHVCDTPVHGPAVLSSVMLIGQAPGFHEATAGKPFSFTAGKTLFRWLNQATGATEEELREMIYISAVMRCFPGKPLKGSGDRPPSPEEIQNCSVHLREEIKTLRPRLIIAVGKVAIQEILKENSLKSFKLDQIVGKKWKTRFHDHACEVIALPHPSGVSRWPHTEVGKAKLQESLKLLREFFSELELA